jgi:hypothetical protein
MVVVSQPDKKTAMTIPHTHAQNRNAVLGKRAVDKRNINGPVNNAQTNDPAENAWSDLWSQWCNGRPGFANKHNLQDG